MKNVVTALVVLGSVLVPSLCAAAAPDQVFVDPNVGLDSNPCTAASPCLTLQHAASVVADPGNITVLASGLLAPVTITTGLTISCPGVACIIDSSANFNSGVATVAVTISAPGKTVALNGVSISGFGTGLTGISVTDVQKLELKSTSISGEQVGLSFTPGTAAGNSHLYALDCEIRNSSVRNIVIAPTSSNSASALFTRTRVHHGNAGLTADATTGTGGVSVIISDSVVSYQNNNSILASGNASGAQSRILLDRAVVSHSSGNCILSSGATATVAMTKTMVTQCTTALNPAGGSIFTYGDNAINFNTSNGPAPTTAGGFR